MISDALFWILTGPPGAAITALLGKDATAVFPGEAPSGQANPYIVFEQIGGEDEMTLDGPTGRGYVRFRFSCYGSKYRDSKQLARAVKQTLLKFTGTCPDGTQFDNAQTDLEGDTFQSAPLQYVTAPELAITYIDTTF